MSDLRKVAFAVMSGIVGFGTFYSVMYETYLDTSDPLLSHLPHPLRHTSYWASKSNWINVYFIKKAWGWTSLAFCLLWLTSSSSSRTPRRLIQWSIATLSWMTFTAWFFGPAILERVILSTGGECVVVFPSGDNHLTLPYEFCLQKSPIVPSEHPELFAQSLSSLTLPAEWRGFPRLRKGHDVSGHIFLLTMSVLFLADQLRSSFRAQRWPAPHTAAVLANVALIGIWLFASYTTSVYFHSPLEKVTGFLLGVATFTLTQIPALQEPRNVPTAAPSRAD